MTTVLRLALSRPALNRVEFTAWNRLCTVSLPPCCRRHTAAETQVHHSHGEIIQYMHPQHWNTSPQWLSHPTFSWLEMWICSCLKLTCQTLHFVQFSAVSQTQYKHAVCPLPHRNIHYRLPYTFPHSHPVQYSLPNSCPLRLMLAALGLQEAFPGWVTKICDSRKTGETKTNLSKTQSIPRSYLRTSVFFPHYLSSVLIEMDMVLSSALNTLDPPLSDASLCKVPLKCFNLHFCCWE